MRLGPPSSPDQSKKRRVDTGVKRTHENCKTSDVLRKLLKTETSYQDTMISFPRASIISQLLKSSLTKDAPGDSDFRPNGFSGTDSETHQEDSCSTSSRCSPPLPPFKEAQFDVDRLSDEHLRAKRARVENIIRGMCHSPGVALCTGENDRDTGRRPTSPREGYRENKRKQRLPQQQQAFRRLVSGCQGRKHEDREQLKLQLEEMQRQLRQLQEKFYQIYDSTDSEIDDGNLSEDSGHSDRVGNLPLYPGVCCSDNETSDQDRGHILDKSQTLFHERTSISESETPKQDDSQGKVQGLTAGKHLAERLKKELNTTVSQVVDAVVKVFAKPQYTPPLVYPSAPMPLDHFPLNHENFHTTNQHLQCFSDLIIPNPVDSFAGAQVLGSTDQTEALPLVVRKSSTETTGAHQHPGLHPSPFSTSMPFRPSSFRHPFPLHVVGYPFQSPLGAPTGPYPADDGSSLESTDLSRDANGLRTKMSSKGLGHHRPISPPLAGNCGVLSSALIKSECGDVQDLSDMSPYSGSTIQEGLSPNHLKKAKLMFFYTRYPSSNMLKMFFSDVKFNRCITSQLIKWFSNFREFYYIQMEKFARQAINDGVTEAEELRVSRDCELYRSLNMHYNKANDFEVPERFIKVAQVTLQEFFNAIVAGKDADPSWKKAIYKVICKLDSEVPEIFKSPNCLQELLHE